MVGENPEHGGHDRLERVGDPDTVRDGVEQMLADTKAMIADREQNGYETLLLSAGDTTPKNPTSGKTDEWGLTYIISGDKEESLLEFDSRADFDETIVYQKIQSNNVFIVIERIDTDQQLSLFISGTYRMQFASEMVRTSMERGEMHSHIKKLDGTSLVSYRYDEPEKFFPDPDRYYQFETNGQ
ncbi:hypothetical protein ACFPYI_08550 [Halomarina salina]|uniref:Uncharacterized protein n=1 Tax=Halomarina salina TaxID=1872699 RepID=A0ABD5RLJ8_9EURY|nr:hypothetical protein [Halomarina salina]